ncbi:Ribonuclease H1 [Halocaridina rubra]|uniref:Ribonuclease H1 n=1 Tax=Halocaridina rubra TaxID=373956 RepID=A0AAN9A330_HALRR
MNIFHSVRFLCFSRAFTIGVGACGKWKLYSKMPFYAVARGLKPGIYEKWTDCQEQIAGYSGARYKKFSTKTEAEEFVKEHAVHNPLVDRRATEDKSAENDESKDSVGGAEKRKHDEAGDEETAKKKKITTDEKTKFSTDGDGFLVVYTDGACEMNGKHGARAGVGVYFGKDHPMNVSEPVRGRATNNMAEIQAATYAVELAEASGFKKVSVHTDSQFMINCMTQWLKGWKKKNWVKSDGEPVKNKDELIALDKACDGLAVKWVYVKGHDGHEGNEEADRLARQGAKLYKAEN